MLKVLVGSVDPQTYHMYTTIREAFISEGMLKGKVESVVEGEARILAYLLNTRGLQLTDELRARIEGCKDEALMQRWFDRAVTAMSLTEIFDD